MKSTLNAEFFILATYYLSRQKYLHDGMPQSGTTYSLLPTFSLNAMSLSSFGFGGRGSSGGE